MKIYQINDIRTYTRASAPSADFDARFTFYYDETNNLKKFYLRENDFNVSFTSNFVLGGLVHEGSPPQVQNLIDSFRLQRNVNEVKFKHIAHGTFLDCLRSEKLKLFLQFIRESDLYVHYSSLNVFYWAIVDIVDSAIANSRAAIEAGLGFGLEMKNALYKVARLEIDRVIDLLYAYNYPNVDAASIRGFIRDLVSLFDDYIDSVEFHFGLESLRQILKESDRKSSLPFVMDDENHILLKDLSHFYFRPVYTFKNSQHIFDNEDLISEAFSEYEFRDDDEIINNYSFVDSKSSQLVQLSDVFIGLMGKLAIYINTTAPDNIFRDFRRVSGTIATNIDLLLDNIDKSNSKNMAFLHAMDAVEELGKVNIIRELRGKP